MAETSTVDELIARERAALEEKVNRGLFGELQRGAGLAARALGPLAAGAAAGAAMGAPFGGVGAIPGAIAGATAAGLAQPVADLAVSGYNYITGRQQPTPSQAYDRLMTAAGVPEPQSASERLASTALRAGTEAMTGAGAARQIAGVSLPAYLSALPSQSAGLASRGSSSPLARSVAETLAAGPGGQTAAAMTGATAAQGAIEAGLPPEAALPIGVAAGVVPTLRPQNVFPARGGAERQPSIDILRERGVPLTPGQELGFPAQGFESVMRYLPTSAPTVARAEDQTMRAYTREILRQAGIEGDTATQQVLQNARKRFGEEYRTLEGQTQLRGDEKLFGDLANIEANYVVGFPDTIRPTYRAKVDEVLKYATGEKQGDGRTYHRLQSQLSEDIARASRNTDPSSGYYQAALQGLQKALADAMERSAPEGLRDQWQSVNRRYALFSRIEDVMARPGQEKLNTGFIPPREMGNVESRRRPQQWAEGGDDFTNFVRAGAAILPDPVPNSGTAQRSHIQDILTGARRSAPVAIGGGAANAAGVSLIDPVWSLAGPYAFSKLWYGPQMSRPRQGLLGMQSLYGASQAEE